MDIPPLQTARLTVRPFSPGDITAVSNLLDVQLEGGYGREERRAWLEWTILGYHQFDRLLQPPYGDRAIVLSGTGELVGACGYVPSLGPFERYPYWAERLRGAPSDRFTPEVGLYYAIAPRHRRQGYATEASRALLDYAFGSLRLARVVATTTYENTASSGVMARLGMRVDRNPGDEPPWAQMVGVIENPGV